MKVRDAVQSGLSLHETFARLVVEVGSTRKEASNLVGGVEPLIVLAI